MITLALTALMASLQPPNCLANGPTPRETIEYAQARVGKDGRRRIRLLLDLYQPQCRTRGEARPAIILFHGGSFRAGARDIDEQVEYAQALAGRGYAVASIQYRFIQDEPFVGARFRPYAEAVRVSAGGSPALAELIEREPGLPNAVAAAVEDASAAVSWIRRRSKKYKIDPSSIALLGASAGSITALNLAYLSDEFGLGPTPIAAVVDVRGRLIEPQSSSSPLQPGSPPLFIIHGDADDRVPPSDAVRLYQLATAARIPVELHLIAKYGHELGGREALNQWLGSGELLIDRLDRFLRAAFDKSLAAGHAICIGALCPSAR